MFRAWVCQRKQGDEYADVYYPLDNLRLAQRNAEIKDKIVDYVRKEYNLASTDKQKQSPPFPLGVVKSKVDSQPGDACHCRQQRHHRKRLAHPAYIRHGMGSETQICVFDYEPSGSYALPKRVSYRHAFSWAALRLGAFSGFTYRVSSGGSEFETAVQAIVLVE